MSEDNIFGLENYPTSKLKRMPDSRDVLKESASKKEKSVRFLREELEKVELNNEQYGRIIDAAKEDLKDLYSKSGIKLEGNDFPRLYFVPNKYKKKFHSGEKDAGTFGINSCGSVVYVHPSGLGLLDVGTIHHELHHGIGRVAVVTDDSSRVYLGQVGHWVQSKKDTGGALEEGTVEYFSKQFVLKSQQRDISKLRSKFAGLLGYSESDMKVNMFEYLFGVWNKEKANRVTSEILVARDPLDEDNFSVVAKEMVANIINRAISIGGNSEGKKMQNLLLRTRRFPKEKGILVEYINTLYNKETSRQIFQASEDVKEVKKINALLDTFGKLKDTTDK